MSAFLRRWSGASRWLLRAGERVGFGGAMMSQPAVRLLVGERAVAFPRRPLILGCVFLESFAGPVPGGEGAVARRASALVSLGADAIELAWGDAGGMSRETEARVMEMLVTKISQTVRCAVPRDETQIFPPLLAVNIQHVENIAVAVSLGVGIIASPSPQFPKRAGIAGIAVRRPYPTDAADDTVAETLVRVGTDEKLRSATIWEVPLCAFGNASRGRMLRVLRQLVASGCPVLISEPGSCLMDAADALARDAEMAACLVAGARSGAAMFRVCNIEMAWRVLRTLERLCAL